MAIDNPLRLATGLTISSLTWTALAQDEHADHDHGHDHAHGDHAHGSHEAVGAIPTVKQGVVTGITALVVFTLVFAVLALKVWPAITKGLDERAAKIRSEIEAAEAARKQAKDALASYERSLSEARAEAQQMLDHAKADQQKLTAELKTKADAELNAMKERAKREIDSARRAAVAEIYAEASSLATSIAGKILAREVNAADQQRLVNEAVAELSAGR